MSVVRIAHISDLHFKPKRKDLNVWHQVAQFINNVVKPHLVLVTGDVTDNARRKELELASQQLRMLAVQANGDPLVYRIIPGNHDSFPALGNTFGFVGGLGYVRDKRGRFITQF